MGIALVVGVFRILKGWPVQYLIIGGYLGVVIMTMFAPPEIIGIAYDSGGVTTSTVTVPLVAALGIGLAHTIHGRDPLDRWLRSHRLCVADTDDICYGLRDVVLMDGPVEFRYKRCWLCCVT